MSSEKEVVQTTNNVNSASTVQSVAQNPASQPKSAANAVMSFVPMVLIFGVFYFFVIRPQSKRAKQDDLMRKNVKVGDKIVLSSGIFGTVENIDAEKGVISVEIASKTSIVVYKSSISKVLHKDEPTHKPSKKKEDAKKDHVEKKSEKKEHIEHESTAKAHVESEYDKESDKK